MLNITLEIVLLLLFLPSTTLQFSDHKNDEATLLERTLTSLKCTPLRGPVEASGHGSTATEENKP